MVDLDTFVYFLFGLVIIGLPAFVFYRIGMDIGITKGIRKQLLRELMSNGVIEEADMSIRSSGRN